MKDILGDKNLDTRTKQLKIENHLFDFYENVNAAEKNEKRLKGRLDIKHKILFSYNERLNILYSNKTLDRKFGKLSLLLNNIK